MRINAKNRVAEWQIDEGATRSCSLQRSACSVLAATQRVQLGHTRYVYTPTYVCTCVCVCVCLYVYICMCMCILTRVCKYIYIYIHIHINKNVYIYVLWRIPCGLILTAENFTAQNRMEQMVPRKFRYIAPRFLPFLNPTPPPLYSHIRRRLSVYSITVCGGEGSIFYIRWRWDGVFRTHTHTHAHMHTYTHTHTHTRTHTHIRTERVLFFQGEKIVCMI